ncbi:winged helix-turn-helix domain-containing protein [Rhodohalobacter sp. 8-1]|uniref:winged helix-turn-helix domain-containing protein n=1 Tax=Rhodohalobacter sp. 8-1 TaxID=3131972 RepID=UPI0030EC5A78
MKLSIDDMHKAFESRVRLGIMSALAVNEELDFSSLKEYLDVTDGNLATHLKKLETENFIDVEKSFVDNKPNTRYSMTDEGKEAFDNHLKVLEQIIKSQRNNHDK